MSSKKNIPSSGLLTIDLGAIQHNWLYLQQRIRKANARANCAAVVKANAYGLGVRHVSQALMAVGCSDFFVATLDEGVELRALLGSGPRIFILGGTLHGFSEEDFGGRWQEFGLIPVLYSIACIDRWIMFCEERAEAFPCVIKVDTGMHRLGISIDELYALLKGAESNEGQFLRFNPVLLMSHLACADEPENIFNQEQLSTFQAAIKKIQGYFPNISLSLSNSSGIFLGDQFHFDLARPGIALYGGNPVIEHKSFNANPMRQVVRLSLPIMQFRTIKSGESVGYGKQFTAKRDTYLATVFGGYADGLLRSLSNRGYAWCGSVRVPIAGRVSMDSIVFDITGLLDKPDSIEVFESKECLDELAASAQTISYEVLTNLGTRYKRQYINAKKSAEDFDLLGIEA